MKQITVKSKGNPPGMALEYAETPQMTGNSVLIRVEFAGINPVDWKTASGMTLADRIKVPYTPGWDCAGTVENTGPACTLFAPGDRVFGLLGFPDTPGTFAEYYAATESQLARIPGEISFEEAAAVPLTALTAWQGLYNAEPIEKGQKVLIHGASGGVGNFALQFAALSGAEVWGTASPHHFKDLRKLGLNHTVDRTGEDFISSLPRHSFDFIFDSRGDGVRDRAGELLRKGGGIVSLRSGPVPEEEYRRAGIRYRHMLVYPDGENLKKIADLFRDGKLGVSVKKVFPMERIGEAFELSISGSVNGKIVLRCR